MAGPLFNPNRRTFLCALGASFVATPPLFAEQLLRTPQMTEGPFYPDKLPLDTDNDLIIVNKNLTPAVGEIAHLTGRVLDVNGAPVKNVVVEIWQCDANEVYLHSSDSGPKARQQDKNFQGFGRCATTDKGEYRFRTIKPVPYPGRPSPHIHFKVKRGNRELITSQIFVRGHAGNARDGVLAGIRDVIDRELVMADFKPIKESKVGELQAYFEIVIGRTPDEKDMDPKRPN
jgi:protocatechuate 3,4-dioxygenase beta subunit